MANTQRKPLAPQQVAFLARAQELQETGEIVSVFQICADLGLAYLHGKKFRAKLASRGLWTFPEARQAKRDRTEQRLIATAEAIEHEGRTVTGVECAEKLEMCSTYAQAVIRGLAKRGLWRWEINKTTTRNGVRVIGAKGPRQSKGRIVQPSLTPRLLEVAAELFAEGVTPGGTTCAARMGCSVKWAQKLIHRLRADGTWTYPKIRAGRRAMPRPVHTSRSYRPRDERRSKAAQKAQQIREIKRLYRELQRSKFSRYAASLEDFRKRGGMYLEPAW